MGRRRRCAGRENRHRRHLRLRRRSAHRSGLLQLPAVGRKVKAGESFGEIESVKAVSDLYSPVDGEIVEVNTALANKLETLNTDPYGAGWIAKIKLPGDAA